MNSILQSLLGLTSFSQDIDNENLLKKVSPTSLYKWESVRVAWNLVGGEGCVCLWGEGGGGGVWGEKKLELDAGILYMQLMFNVANVIISLSWLSFFTHLVNFMILFDVFVFPLFIHWLWCFQFSCLQQLIVRFCPLAFSTFFPCWSLVLCFSWSEAFTASSLSRWLAEVPLTSDPSWGG